MLILALPLKEEKTTCLKRILIHPIMFGIAARKMNPTGNIALLQIFLCNVHKRGFISCHIFNKVFSLKSKKQGYLDSLGKTINI